MKYTSTINSASVFVDTSAWIEYWLKNEQYSKEVSAYIKNKIKSRAKIFTSDYVLDETFTRLITNQSFKAAKDFSLYINSAQENDEAVILFTDQKIFEKAWNNFEKFSEHKLSFTDCTICTFVKDLKIDEIVTLDRGFEKVGFSVKPEI